MNKKNIIYFLLIGTLFTHSAYSKVYPIDYSDSDSEVKGEKKKRKLLNKAITQQFLSTLNSQKTNNTLQKQITASGKLASKSILSHIGQLSSFSLPQSQLDTKEQGPIGSSPAKEGNPLIKGDASVGGDDSAGNTPPSGGDDSAGNTPPSGGGSSENYPVKFEEYTDPKTGAKIIRTESEFQEQRLEADQDDQNITLDARGVMPGKLKNKVIEELKNRMQSDLHIKIKKEKKDAVKQYLKEIKDSELGSQFREVQKFFSTNKGKNLKGEALNKYFDEYKLLIDGLVSSLIEDEADNFQEGVWTRTPPEEKKKSQPKKDKNKFKTPAQNKKNKK
ncbi:hypothetical protein [Holospora undulata]|uniref:Uncharacterized protein n=1 Tax=Holospora undulata HU1 TaxID=1321371 RepID=A0A061JG66_9PROT|nr:hypothetical protein [Holospora undulata]ETZ04835.1 hypothetical protein K737_300763 [Holospora undulata HU1]